MNRREFIALVGGAGCGAGLRARATTCKSSSHRHIGDGVAPFKCRKHSTALRRGLREFGYVENQNYDFEYRSADGDAQHFPELAAELVRLGVDLIVTRGTPAARAAKEATETIPIVMAAIGEPLGMGIVASLARPGGNVTGLSSFVTELAGKRVELLREFGREKQSPPF